MARLTIEWRHYDADGETCSRCSATGDNLVDVIADLKEELKQHGIEIYFVETKLTAERMAESNLILFNGVPIEELLANAQSSENCCPSCSCLTGAETSCRTVVYGGKTYEEIPEDMIRTAAYKAAGIPEG